MDNKQSKAWQDSGMGKKVLWKILWSIDREQIKSGIGKEVSEINSVKNGKWIKHSMS